MIPVTDVAELRGVLKNNYGNIQNIDFLSGSSGSDVKKIINSHNGPIVIFEQCVFHKAFDFQCNVKSIFFIKCTFKQKFTFSSDCNNLNIKILFENCSFMDDVLMNERDDYFTFNNLYFHNCKFLNLSQPSARYCKYKFEGIRDFIQADIFFALEMEQVGKSLTGVKNIPDRFIYGINQGFSNFGQSWVRPMLWWLGVSFIFYIEIIMGQNISLPTLPDSLTFSQGFWYIANPLTAFHIPKENEFYAWFLFHKVFSVIMIYLMIVGIKRKTRR